MSLVHEAVIKNLGYRPGDMKIISYNITFTANQLIEPNNDPGWFLLNGSIISQTTYPLLYARFGLTFNIGGEGTGNFRLPDLTDGKIPLPKGLANLTAYGANGGELNHILSAAEMNSHSHADTFSVSVGSHDHSDAGSSVGGPDESHTHLSTYLIDSNVGGSSGGNIVDANTGITGSGTNTDGQHVHGFSGSINAATSPNLSVSGGIAATGSGNSHNNIQPYIVLGGWLVKYG